MRIFLDVETVPSQAPGARDLVRRSIKPPATMTVPSTIEKWWAERSADAIEEAYRKQSLDGGLHGELVSIACVTDTDRSWVYCRRQDESERDLLECFFAVVEMWTAELAQQLRMSQHDSSSAWPLDNHYLVTHNAPFDLGYLWRRAKVLSLPTPRWLPSPSARSGKDYGDTMTFWAGYGNRVSLDALCAALGVPSPKGDLEGSQVFDAWLAGEYERIAAYNLADSQACKSVWERLS